MKERARFEREIQNLELEAPSPDLIEEFKKEIGDDEHQTCNRLDANLMRKFIDFNNELKKKFKDIGIELKITVTRCYRSQSEQKEWHYARMITWSASEIQKNVRAAANTNAKALEIKKNALDLFKEIRGITDDDEATREAQDLRDKRKWGANPVAAAEYDCPCGCRWPRSAHTFDHSLAIDFNISRKEMGKDRPIVNSSSLPNRFAEYQVIKEVAQKFGIAWGIDWSVKSSPYMPRDAIHLEISGSTKDALPPYPKNPGPLDSWNLRNIGQGGQGPLTQGDLREKLVRHLQEMLIQRGFPVGPYGIDGDFGGGTTDAVVKFQKDPKYGKDFSPTLLSPDGIVGALTADSLNSSMIGLWYSRYETPQKLKDNYDALKRGTIGLI